MSKLPEEKLDIILKALDDDEFTAYFQPQYNVFTGMLVGTEALARLESKEYGLVYPGEFISFMEEHHIIGRLDMAIIEKACAFVEKCKSEGIHTVPVSVNLSREYLYREGLIDDIEAIRKKHGLKTSELRIEVTESIAQGGPEMAKAIVDEFHRLGYVVELDDFGSGYSSLNILKDIEYDILKLDLNFLTNDLMGRGGTIVSSIVRMAKWLKMPVIAEGVETKEHADFMRSIGCDYAQGYLYSKPISPQAFKDLLLRAETGDTTSDMKIKESVNPVSFWSEKSLETLIFNNYVGAAAVFSYNGTDRIEFLRVNRKYVKELCMNMSEQDIINTNLYDTMDENARSTYNEMLTRAIETEEEQECETWRTIKSGCCGDEKLCIRAAVTLIGKSKNEYIFYTGVRNVTAEKKMIIDGSSYERGFRNITEQANIYYWEYDVATKEMHPCFRCMRDLGLPPLVKNYPEPAIEQGIFPADYADMYRDWHKQIAAGVEHLEAVIPLTVGRVPFHVRYTTEFDELHRPIKAYGSATLVTEAETK